MAREPFILYAVHLAPGAFARFNEAANIAAIEAGEVDHSDPYAWVEAVFEVRLIREGERTHCCALAPSSYYVNMRHVFVGSPNAAWAKDGDPDRLEPSTGSDDHGYMGFLSAPDPRRIVARFAIDTTKELGVCKPRIGSKKEDAYYAALWQAAEDYARDLDCNGRLESAPIFDVYVYRQWEREKLERRRRQSCEDSKRARFSWPRDLLAPYEEFRSRAERPELWMES